MRDQDLAAGMRRHGPLFKIILATLASFVALAALRLSLGEFGAPTLPVLPLLLGVLWGHLFEYGWHRVALHQDVRWFRKFRERHLRHHARLHGEHFTARGREDLEVIATSWLSFPTGLAVHFLVLLGLTSGAALVAFLGGCCLHYLFFEVNHWFMHVENSELDALIGGIPGLRELRHAQIAHHAAHHERPNANFSFTAPFLGDHLAGTRYSGEVVVPVLVPVPGHGSTVVLGTAFGRTKRTEEASRDEAHLGSLAQIG